ncbi:MAG: sterol desaturase family protein [Bacteroidetes Order II. Incertae sedis bacterium]|nr:sterol desaturase family protein [Bacteroidetes Order II. bacterium]
MERYLQILTDGYRAYAEYLLETILHPAWNNIFYWLIAVSAFFLLLEWLTPWRKDQPKFRQDFWLDFFYMFFNFFLFSLVGYAAVSDVVVVAFNDLLAQIGIQNLVALEIRSWPVWAQLLTLFVIRDFIQWNTHILLHRVPFLWNFHKVHHSVEQMGFAAHLRYHWMENIVYSAIQYLPLAMIGFGISDFFVVYLATLVVGHYNHANINIPLGPLKYLFNNPQMHIWHHAKAMPGEHPYGVNFGLTLSIWDYLFKTDYIPSSGRDIPLGFDDIEHFPKTFWGQLWYGLKKEK